MQTHFGIITSNIYRTQFEAYGACQNRKLPFSFYPSGCFLVYVISLRTQARYLTIEGQRLSFSLCVIIEKIEIRD